MEFKTLTQVQRAVGITSKEDWECWETSYPGVGIIVRDQDKKRLEPNRMNINGTFAFVGLETKIEGKNKLYIFSPLTDQQANDIKLGLAIKTFKDIWSNSVESEAE
jgi:hypothetical protein